MRNPAVTRFWKHALEQLPAEIRARYAADFEAAERWELRLDALIEVWAQAKSTLGRMFQTPRSAH